MTRPTALDRGWQLLYRAAYPLARAWWRMRKKLHRGALVAISVGDSLLLVRSSYRPEWSLPGGGVKPGETPLQAAVRELREELGIGLPIQGEPVVIRGSWDGRPEIVHIFPLSIDQVPPMRVDQREVIGARLVSRAELGRLRLSGPARDYLKSTAHDEHA